MEPSGTVSFGNWVVREPGCLGIRLSVVLSIRTTKSRGSRTAQIVVLSQWFSVNCGPSLCIACPINEKVSVDKKT